MVAIRKAVATGVVDPASLTAAERRQHSGWLRREAENAGILALADQGVSIKEIMRRTDKSRGLVRKVVRGARNDIFRGRMSSLEPFLVQLETAWSGGSRNGAALWRAVKAKGFTGGLRVVSEWANRQRKDEGAATRDNRPGKTPSARSIARMMTTERDTLSKVVARTVAMIGDAVPDLTAARDLLDRFHRLIQQRKDKHLDDWLADAKAGLMSSFATGIGQDHAAVKAVLTELWSNGQTEGQNTKLKLVKRQMYGRASLDLLRARLIGVTEIS
jgi:transposase